MQQASRTLDKGQQGGVTTDAIHHVYALSAIHRCPLPHSAGGPGWSVPHRLSVASFSEYIMKTSLAFLSLLAAGADAFVPAAPVLSTRAAVSSSATSAVQHVPMRMGLNPELAANFPRDFAAVSACRFAAEDHLLWQTNPRNSSAAAGAGSVVPTRLRRDSVSPSSHMNHCLCWCLLHVSPDVCAVSQAPACNQRT